MTALTEDQAAVLAASMTVPDEFEREVSARHRTLQVDRAARQRIAREEAASQYPAEDSEHDGLLSDLFSKPRRFEEQRVAGLIGMTHNSVLAAQFKSGKTTLGCNVMAAAVTGSDFLHRKVVLPDGERVGWVNGEMDRDDFLDYIRPMGIGPSQAERVYVRNLRGRSLNLLNDLVAERFAHELREHGVTWLWIDSWRLLCSWAGVNENINSEVEQLTQRLDWLKSESGVQTVTLLAHTGRAQHEEGREHARGATALDDWQDSRLILTRQGSDRFLYAEGRGVGMEETLLVFDEQTHVLTLGDGNRRNSNEKRGVQAVTELMSDPANHGKNSTELKALLRGLTKETNVNNLQAMLQSAVEAGVVRREKSGNAWLHYPGDSADLKSLGEQLANQWS